MKKLMALALALLMMATTVSLASCKKDKDTDSDDDDDYEYNYNDTNDSSARDTSDSTGKDTSKKDTGKNNTSDNADDDEWIEKNDTVCVGMNDVALREGPGKKYEAVKTLKMGTSLKRTGTNGTWCKVTYNDKTYYVNAAYVTADTDDFEFVDYAEAEQVTLTVKGDNQINLRTSPFYNADSSDDNIGISGLDSDNTDTASGNLLKLVAVSKSGDWYKVSYTGKLKSGTTYTDKIFYMAASSAKYVNGITTSSSSSGNGGTVRG